MVGRSKIVDISRNLPSARDASPIAEGGDEMIAMAVPDQEAPHIEPDSVPVTDFTPDYVQEWEEESEVAPRQWKAIIFGTLLIALFAGWTGFFGWANRAELITLTAPARIAELIALWAIPTSLIALGWLLAMRLSSREASRFGDVAVQLRTESEALEARMRTVNGEIALARSFLAENARELDSVGRISAKKLTEAAEQLVVALADSEAKGQMLQSVSAAAVSNVEMLRDHLPVVTSAAKDTTNQIGNAGNAANEQIQNLSASLRAMDEALTETSATMKRMEELSSESAKTITTAAQSASEQLIAATADSEERTDMLIAKLQDGIAAIENKLGESAENIEALADANSQKLDTQIAGLDNAILRVGQAADTQDQKLGALVAQLDTSLDESGQRLAAIGSDAGDRFDALIARLEASIGDCDNKLGVVETSATDRIAKLAFALNALAESSGELSVNLSGNAHGATSMLAEAEKLMAVLDSIARELGSNIPASFDVLKKGAASSHESMLTLRNESDALEAHSAKMAERMGELDALVARQKAAVSNLLAEGSDAIHARQQEVDALAASLNNTRSLIAEVATSAEEKLSGSLQRVAEAAYEAANSSKAIVESELSDISERLSTQNKELLSGAIDAQLAGLGSAVNDAITRNLALSEDAAGRVSAQLQSVSELTANLEQRAATAREQFDGIDSEAFSRRMALLTESLNSAAIDVAKILSNDVTDTAWAAYLKGDRGVFTRRAVRLLDSGEARIIATQYGEDPEFRDHVNRYIHDFEAMMRVLLSTRDGNAIGVTLLSSDVGKLYVALAQAIDRLRS
jgi:hypothetical protein